MADASMKSSLKPCRPRSLLFVVLLLPILFLSFFLFHLPPQPSIAPSPPSFDDPNEQIHLADLFRHAFRLTYESGRAIKSFKTAQKKYRTLQGKKSLDNQTIEPVTLADLLSHSILTNGLKRQFPNLHIVSEEKNAGDDDEIRLLKKDFHRPNPQVKVPPIVNDRELMNVPLSSVAVWIDPLDATQEFTENLLEYVMVMVCVTIEKQPTIGILYAPFTDKIHWGWVDVGHSPNKPDETLLRDQHQPGVDEIVISRSHAGSAHEFLRDAYRDAQYKIIPAAGSGYKATQVLQGYADYYLHVSPIKKWDLCAPDAILRANSGLLTTLKNRTIDYDHFSKEMLVKDGLLATHKRNHNDVLSLLSKVNLTKSPSHKSKKH